MLRAAPLILLLLCAACGADEPEDVPVDVLEIGPPNDVRLPDVVADSGVDLTLDTNDVPTDGGNDADVVVIPPGQLSRVNILISAENINALHRDVQADVEVEVGIDFDGVVYDDGELEIHGGFARTVPKLSYRIRFDSDQLLETTLFSDEAERHQRVVLQASWIDPAYMRNCLTMDLVRELGGMAPRCDYIELYFNGDYHGLYLAIERVDEHFLRRNGLADNGLVLKASSNWADWSNVENPMAGFEVKVNRDAPTASIAELITRVQLTPADYQSFVNEVEPWLNVADFMSWQLAHTLADNRDTFKKNYYLHYDWEGGDSPFQIISWDADATWGLNWDGAAVDATERSVLWGNDRFSPRLFGIPEYFDPYEARYRDLVFSGELEDWLHGNLAARAERIEDAAIRDLAAWGREHEFDGELEYLEASIDVRFDTLRSVLD